MNSMVNTLRPYLPRLASIPLVLVLLAVAVGGVGSLPASAAPEAQNNLHLPLVMKTHCSSRLPDTPFAFQFYGASGVTNAAFPFLSESGATWVRDELDWGRVEPTNLTPDQYQWAVADQVVAAAKDGCFNVILTHVFNAPWAATERSGVIDKVGLDEFAQYINALVERYDGDGVADAPNSPVVSYFELYNEPDAGQRPGADSWGTHGAEYAAMLAAVYPAVKAANPNAQVVFGGIAHDGFSENGGVFIRPFLDDVLNAGGGQFFDVMNFHQYPAFAATWNNGTNGPGLLEKTVAIRQKLLDHGLIKPIIITETGWHSNNDPVYPGSIEMQSRYVVALYVQSLASGVKLTAWWPLRDLPNNQFDSGLITVDTPPQKKPGFDTYKLMTEILGPAQFVRTLPTSETGNVDIEVHEFTTSGQKLYVTWLDPVNQTDKPGQPLKLSANQVAVTDLHGVASTVNDGDDGASDGKVTLSVSKPLYVRVVP